VKLWSDRSIRAKILFSFGLVLAVVIFAGFYAINSVQELHRGLAKAAEDMVGVRQLDELVILGEALKADDMAQLNALTGSARAKAKTNYDAAHEPSIPVKSPRTRRRSCGNGSGSLGLKPGCKMFSMLATSLPPKTSSPTT
jgi:hypothetical protein